MRIGSCRYVICTKWKLNEKSCVKKFPLLLLLVHSSTSKQMAVVVWAKADFLQTENSNFTIVTKPHTHVWVKYLQQFFFGLETWWFHILSFSWFTLHFRVHLKYLHKWIVGKIYALHTYNRALHILLFKELKNNEGLVCRRSQNNTKSKIAIQKAFIFTIPSRHTIPVSFSILVYSVSSEEKKNPFFVHLFHQLTRKDYIFRVVFCCCLNSLSFLLVMYT